MIRTILKIVALALTSRPRFVIGRRFYQFFGLRFVMDGGGTPVSTFRADERRAGERIERHREAQRAAAARAHLLRVAEPDRQSPSSRG